MSFAGIESWRATSLPSLSRDVMSLVLAAALGEVVPELFLFCLVKAFQIEFQLHAERAHRTMTGTGFLAVLFDRHVLPDAL